MASGVAPYQKPIEVDREYEEPISPPPLGFVLKTAILPHGDEIWNGRRQDVVNGLLERGVQLTRHNEFVTLVTGFFKDVLREGQENHWALQKSLAQGHQAMCGPVEAMDMWLLEQPGATHFVPVDF